jgi:DNA primase
MFESKVRSFRVWQEHKEQVKLATDLVILIESEGITLVRKGRRYWGHCPFHSDDTPSFSVNRERGLFYCFGCNTGGDCFTFLQKTKSITFKEAVKELAVRF